MSECTSYTLSQALDLYFMRRFVDRPKHSNKFLTALQFCYSEMFKKTLWAVQNKWVEIYNGNPYPFVYVPQDNERFFSLSVVDNCGNTTPLYYNAKLNVIPKPTVLKSPTGCTTCDCSGLCGEVNNFTVTTKPVVIGGHTYYEKTFLKYCPSGEIIEYREIPTQKFTTIQQAGDYNLDYNDDYLIPVSFQNYTVVTEEQTRVICNLSTKPCGCPEDTPSNVETFVNNCGCFVGCWQNKLYCSQFMDKINYDCRGEINFSQDGTRIYIKQPPAATTPPALQTKNWALISYQTNGIQVGADTLVPEYSLKCLWSMLDYASKEFNDAYTWNEKEAARIKQELEINNLILYLNSFSLERLAVIQDSVIQW